MTGATTKIERRKKSDIPMSDAQFREWTMASLEEGTKQFESIDTKVERLTEHISTLTGHVETFSAALVENTELTKKTAEQSQRTAELAQKTADDTADLVRISQFGKKVSRWGRFTAASIAFLTRAASKLSKLLIPIFIVYAIASALWHGEPIRWKDVLEVIK